jgi:hypothetical protein
MSSLSPEQLAALVSVPAAIAVIVTVGLFLRHITEQRKEDRLTWSNHLSQSIAVQAETARNLGALATALAVMQESNKSGMEWAKDSMAMLIREIGRAPSKE